MEERDEVVLSSNWNTLGDVDLGNILVKNPVTSFDIEIKDLEADKCVCLLRSKITRKTKAELDIKTNGFITDIILLSEAQVTEVFGVNDEYILTNTARFFDDWEEMAVYYTKISLPNIPVCKLKFIRSKCENRLWIYAVKILIKNTNQELRSPVQFNGEQIKRLLRNSNIRDQNNFRYMLPLFLENLPTNSSTSASGKKLGGNDYKSPKTDTACDVNNKENLLEDKLKRLNITSESGESQVNVKESNEETGSNTILAYIDKKCNEIKSDILHEVDMKLNSLREETNSKLDKIISLLENERK